MTQFTDWISISEAATRIPSPLAGKQTHPATIRGLIRKHRLTTQRRGPYRFVFWPDIAALMQPEDVVDKREIQHCKDKRVAADRKARHERLVRNNLI